MTILAEPLSSPEGTLLGWSVECRLTTEELQMRLGMAGRQLLTGFGPDKHSKGFECRASRGNGGYVLTWFQPYTGV